MAVRGYDFTSDQKFEESCGFPTEHFLSLLLIPK